MVFISHNTISHFQVNGTLVTHSNHIEVVKLIKCKSSQVFCQSAFSRNVLHSNTWSINLDVNLMCLFDFSILAGSYVALTVLGRPPGLAQIPLSEAESEMLGVSISSPNSPAAERPYSPQDRLSSTQLQWVHMDISYFSCPLLISRLFLFHLAYICLCLSSKSALIFVVASFFLECLNIC